MKERTVFPAVAAVSIVVAAGTLLLWGWNAEAAHAMARNTARVAGLWFALALAEPGLARFRLSRAPEVRWMLAFVTAQAVHFVAVIAVLVGFDWKRAGTQPLRSVLVVGIGGGLLALLGWASIGAVSRGKKVAAAITISLIFLIFFGAFARHPWPIRALAVPLLLGLILRLTAWMPSPSTQRTGSV